MKMSNSEGPLRSGFLAGIKRGWSSFVWMCKVIIPVSFVVTLLQWTGWLNQLDFLLNPLTGVINLPPEAALPIITGMVINLYAVIAIITALPFTVEQMTLIAIFNMIAHSLIMEGIIQHKSGMNIIKTTVVRVTAAILTVLVVSQFLGDTSQSIAAPAYLMVQTPFLDVLKGWAVDMMGLLLRIIGIIMVVMIILECSKTLGWTPYLVKLTRPLMKVLGLPDRTATMWVTAVIFGLFYGGAVIIEEAKESTLLKEELERLHISVGINHAMVEDPALFAVLGLNPFWLWVPRFIMAIAVVQAYRGVEQLRNKLLHS